MQVFWLWTFPSLWPFDYQSLQGQANPLFFLSSALTSFPILDFILYLCYFHELWRWRIMFLSILWSGKTELQRGEYWDCWTRPQTSSPCTSVNSWFSLWPGEWDRKERINRRLGKGTGSPASVVSSSRGVRWREGYLKPQWLRICLPVQGTQVRSLLREDPTTTEPVRHIYWSPRALGSACRNYWAHVLQLLNPVRLEPMLCNKRSHCREKPVHLKEE